MTAPFSALNTKVEIDSRLEQIIEAAVGRLQAGEPMDLAALVAAHPEYAAELQELLPTIARLARIGQSPREPVQNTVAIGEAAAQRQQIGEFKLIREIGHGGMGTVFEAEQLSMGRRVALKVLPFAAMVQEKALQRFHNEVRAAAALDHPHIVSIYSVGEERGVHFYAMQLVRGRTLADLISELREAATDSAEHAGSYTDAATIDSAAPPSPDPRPRSECDSTKRIEQAHESTLVGGRRAAADYRLVARLGIQAAEALQHAHDLGVLHRDIKPSNLLLDRVGKLYVTDFGLARMEADAGLTMTGDIVGTLRYMAPEQVLGKRVVVDHRVDIYSLGATLFELLALEPAFGETDRAALFKQIAFDDPPSIRKHDRRAPAELETIISKAMAKNRDERYDTAQQLADDLRAFLEGRPTTARPISPLGRARKWAWRHQAPVTVAAAALVVLSSVLAISTVKVKRSETRAVAALKETSELLYEADVALAFETLENGRPEEAGQILARRLPTKGILDTRSFAWRLLQSAVGKPTSFALVGHEGAVNELAWFSDHRRLASVGNDGTLRIWDMPSKTLLREFQLGREPLFSVAVSRTKRYVAAGSKLLYLCDLQDGDVHVIFRAEHNFESLAFRADGKQIAAGSRYHDVFVITPAGELVGRIPCGSRVWSIAFVGEDNLLMFPNRTLTGDKREYVGVLELRPNDLSAIEKVLYVDERTGGITIARPLGETRYVLVGDRYNARAHLVDRASGEVFASTNARGIQLTDIAVSPDRTAAAFSYLDGVIEHYPLDWDDQGVPTLGNRRRVFRAHRGEVSAVCFPNSWQLASCGTDGAINVWNIKSPPPMREYDLEELNNLNSVNLSPDGSKLVATGAGGQRVLSCLNARVLDRSVLRYSRSSWSPTGDRIALGDRTKITILNRYWRKVCRIELSAAAEALAFSPRERLIAAVGEKHLQLFDTESGELVAEQALNEAGKAVAFSHDGKWVAYGANSDEIRICDVPDLQPQHVLPNALYVRSIAFSPDDKTLATGHQGGMVRLWDVEAGRVRAELAGHTGNVVDVAFSPDGYTLLSCDGNDVRVWSVEHARSYGIFCDSASRMSLSANGRALAVVPREADSPDVRMWSIDE